MTENIKVLKNVKISQDKNYFLVLICYILKMFSIKLLNDILIYNLRWTIKKLAVYIVI